MDAGDLAGSNSVIPPGRCARGGCLHPGGILERTTTARRGSPNDTPDLDASQPLPSGLGAALGLPREPRQFTGLQVTEDAGA